MLNLEYPIKYSKRDKKYIKSLGKPKYADWDVGKSENVRIKKEVIKKQLMRRQDKRCAYCGLPLYETSRPEIEHIAPRELHPEFAYVRTNLVIACQYCNGSSKKGRKDTVSVKRNYYNRCEFSMVHPYYDNVDYYFERKAAIIFIASSLSETEKKKAGFTLELFGLSTPEQCQARMKQILWDRAVAQYSLDELNEKLAENISIYI